MLITARLSLGGHLFGLLASTRTTSLPPSLPSRGSVIQSSSSSLSMTDLDIPQRVEKGHLYIVWTSTPTWPAASSAAPLSRVNISVLDSSYNPPTVAHGQIAAARIPSSSTALRVAGLTSNNEQADGAGDDDYSARLLLFSTTNVDKTPAPHDPTIQQRMTMIQKLALNLPTALPSVKPLPIAIGLICEATFVGKSSIIHSYFSNRIASLPRPRLTFLIGTDTLTRFFEPRYYPEGSMHDVLNHFFDEERSVVISARRGRGHDVDVAEEEVLKRDYLRRWLKAGSLRLLEQPDEGGVEWGDVSSTAVRRAVKASDRAALDKLLIKSIAQYIEEQGLYH